jgi:hypothetical protein
VLLAAEQGDHGRDGLLLAHKAAQRTRVNAVIHGTMMPRMTAHRLDRRQAGGVP